jgi:hypothetical protein
MKEEDKIERTFKEKLDDYKVPVAASAWAGIESALGNATTSVAGSISTLFYAAAVVGSVVFTTAIVSHNQSGKQSEKENTELAQANKGDNTASEQENIVAITEEDNQSAAEDTQSSAVKKTKQANTISADLSNKKREKYIVKEVSNSQNNNSETTIKVEKISENTLYTKINTSVSGGYAPLKVDFSHESSPETKVRWNFGDKSESFTNEPTHTYYRPGSYKVSIIITDKNGSTAVDYKYIEVKEGSYIKDVSSVITPNDDDRNDVVTLSHKNIIEFSMKVYNSSGKQIFSSNNIETLFGGYDNKGKKHPSGNYPYVIKAKGVDGKEYELGGQVTVLENYRP